MHASAHLTVARSRNGRGSRITRLYSDPPLVLRPTNPAGPEPLCNWQLRSLMPARASLVAGAAGPIGGDDFRLSIDVQSGAALVLRAVAASLVLPGPHGQPSRSIVTLQVAEDGVLVWLPGALIAARGCCHQEFIGVNLEERARFFLREEHLLGRHDEQPGSIRRRLRVCRDERPVLDQELAVGIDWGWNGPAVTGGRKALGSVLIVDPNLDHSLIDSMARGIEAEMAVLRLGGPAVLVTALAKDTVALRRRLDAGIAAVETALQRSRS